MPILPLRSFPSAAAAVALALLLPAVALAGHGESRGHGKGHGKGFGHLERAVERLELDPATGEAVAGILDEARQERRSLHEELRQEHEVLREMLRAESPDAEAVMAQADRLGALRTEMRKQWLRAMLQVRETVGPERWAEMREALHERRGRHHGGGR